MSLSNKEKFCLFPFSKEKSYLFSKFSKSLSVADTRKRNKILLNEPKKNVTNYLGMRRYLMKKKIRYIHIL